MPPSVIYNMKKSRSIFGDKQGGPEIWNSIKFAKRKLPEELIASQKNRLMEGILDDKKSTPIIPIQPRKTIWIWYAAASIVLLMTVGSFLLLKENNFETSYGQIATVHLPDGTSVTLNGNSSISYSPISWRFFNNRNVSLTGEAFFDVAKKEVDGKRIKFQVLTRNLQVEVLGTRFNVIDREGNESVVLEEGKVQLMIPDVQIPLQMVPGDYVGYDASKKRMLQMVVLTEEYTSWKDKYILLDNKTLGELAQIITTVYGKKVVFQNDEDKKIPLEGKVPSDEIRILIAALRLATKLEISLENDVVTVSNSSKTITI
ncbi:ferric-dicitrate binding protein FerR, regulates iron transport through sigma-19 [Algoriphagus aquimarinus]|uniref:Ferric-dicitrate binding protein FerR, regulates iron transport through sigma-19 n=2 Tax=Algoriphagus aquimarinus TaxID=237018 RepID=A0A1I0YCT8_9BACT|nr:ferric-dicitrate binding protein FerR, regulates iron transport through sigma-19 [Algoriphagus aquimarinus]